MCDLATGVMLLSTAVGAAGQYQEGKYNKAIMYRQARLEDQKAKDAVDRGLAEEKKSNRQYLRIKGQQANQLAASGLSLDSGSPADVLAGTEGMRAEDAEMIRFNAQRERWGFMENAKSYRSQGDMAKKAGTMAAVSTVINGVSTVAGKWYKPGSVGGKAMGIGQGTALPGNNFYQGNGNLTWLPE